MPPRKHESAIREVALFGCRNLVNLLRIAKHWSNGHRTPSTLLCWPLIDVLPLVMLISLKNSVSDASDSSPALDSIQTELDRWKNLIFSFDMDEENSSSSSNPSSSNPQRSRSPPGTSGSRDNNTRDLQDAVLLAQFAASSNAQQVNGPLDPSVVALLQALQVVQSQRYPPPNIQGSLPPGIPLHLLGALQQQSQAQQFLNMPWPQQQSSSSGGLFPNQNPNAGFPPHMLPYLYDQMSQSNYYHVPPPQGAPTQSVASTSTAARPASPPDTDSLEGGADDKRKRNTAASARFRIKKKQKTLNLERSVSDLTGRAEELEKEAADLRRENGWLKEIVMLKGSRLAGVHLTPDTVSSSMWDHGRAATLSPSGDGPSTEKKDGDSGSNDDSSDSEYIEGRAKGKGKGKGKARQR
ncbi:hypothetical protein DFS33DRAFT_1451429 [Desarmillaria ectypa]|nr:hypothetical protein DFS33DRAFT_1451429 [Desarmillaria ectypa]